MTDWKTVTVNGVAFKRRVAFGRSAETLRAVKDVPKMAELFAESYGAKNRGR